MIDLDQINPDWKLAEAHAQSTRPGRSGHNIQEMLRCPCCFRPIDKTPIEICKNSKELECLGFGFPLYYKFLKYTIIMIFLQVVSYNALALYWSYQDNIPFCRDHLPHSIATGEIQHCTGFFVSIARLEFNITPAQQIIRVASFIIQMLALVYIRDKLTKANSYYDEITTTMSDFSVILKDVPAVIGVQAKIRKMFEQFFSAPYKIEELVVIGHLKEFYLLEREKKKLLEKKKRLIGREEANEDEINAIDYEIRQNEELTQEEINKEIQAAVNDTLICQKIIITLESDPKKEQLIREFNQKIREEASVEALRLLFDDEEAGQIVIMQAPQPNQIIWEHININRYTRWIRQIIGWVLAVLLIAVITIAIYFLLQLKASILQHSSQSGTSESSSSQLHLSALVIVYGFIFSIVFINKFIIAPILHIIAEYEMHPTKDKEEYSFGLKYTLSLFFTTALMTLVVEDATLHNIYAHDYGVIEEESIMFFVSALFVPLLWIINPWYIFRLVKRRLSVGKKGFTQKQANQIMEDVPISLGKLYGQIIETVWFTYMYATVIPIGAMVTFLGLCIHYWVDKYNLLHRSSIYSEVSGKMCLRALKLLDITLILRPFGSLIFDFQIKSGYTIQSIVCAGVALVFILLPWDCILAHFHGEQFLLEEKSYSQVKEKFVSNYKTLHPIVAHKKMLLQSELSNLNFFSFNNKLKKKLSKKVSMTIEMSLLTPKKGEPSASSAKEVLI